MKQQPVNIHAGHADLVAGVHITSNGADPVEADAGQPITVRMTYCFDPATYAWEGAIVRLRTRVDGGPWQTQRIEHEKHLMANNERRGCLTTRHIAPGEGAHTIEYELAADYRSGDWHNTRARSDQVERSHGQVALGIRSANDWI